jgi:hypothetical protein
MQQYPESDPRRHTAQIKQRLREDVAHLRQDIAKVSEPKAQALFETTAEVLEGLANAFDHYEQREPAWR